MRLKQNFVALFLAVFMAGTLAGHAMAQTAAAAVTFQSAAARGLIDYSFEGMGGSSGASVRLKVKRGPKAPNSMPPITIPPGTMLRSSNAGAQSMVVSNVLGVDKGNGFYAPMSQIRLVGQSWVTILLSAFCAEFEKDNPPVGTTFSVERPDPTLACITRQSNKLPVAAEQAAVWMYTDHLTYDHMREKFQVSPQQWASAEAVVQRCQGR